MKKIELRGWNVGFNKVEFTKLLQGEPGYSLKHSKDTTDAILAGESVLLEVSDEQYEEQTRRIKALGARVKTEER